jgi:hypothetical protein
MNMTGGFAGLNKNVAVGRSQDIISSSLQAPNKLSTSHLPPAEDQPIPESVVPQAHGQPIIVPVVINQGG